MHKISHIEVSRINAGSGKVIPGLLAMLLLVLISLPALGPAALAQTTTWNGSVSNEWSDPANWSNGVPDANTSANIQWFPPANPDPLITSNTSFSGLTINNFGREVRVNVAPGVEVEMDNLAVAATETPGQIAFDVGDGHVTVNNPTSISGAIFVDDGSITFLDDFSLVSSSLVTVQTGTVNIGHPGPPVINADLVIGNDATFNLNNGSLNIYGNSAFNNSGAFNAGSGNIVFDGNISLDGNADFNPETSTVTITSNSIITVGSNIDGNTINFYDLEIEEGANVVSEANVFVNNNMTVDDDADYQNVNNTTLNVVGTVTGDPEIITERPYIVSIDILGPTTIRVNFDNNNPLEQSSAETAANYEVFLNVDKTGKVADATSAVLSGANNNVVTLELAFEAPATGIESDVQYYLFVNNVANVNGEPVNDDHRKRFIDDSPPVFYSITTGAWNQTSSWSIQSHTGPAASRAPGQAGDQVVIGNSHTITINSSVSLDPLASLTVNSTGTLTVGSSGTLTTLNKAVTGDGAIELASGGTLQIGSPDGIAASGNTGNIRTASRSFSTAANYIYGGTSAQVTGTGLPQQVNNLSINNSGGVDATSDLFVAGTLNLSSGQFTILSGNSLIADTRTGSGTVRYLRNITGNKGWRLISSPVGTTFGDFLSGPGGGFTTQGFSGADLPDQQPNILHFAENTPGDTVTTNMAWRSISSLSGSVSPGSGYFAYAFDGADGPGSVPARGDQLPFTISVSGTENTADPFDFGVTYTARQIYTEDEGWNLVGNPYGASLDWDDEANWNKTDIHETIYVWDPNANGGDGAYLEWNGATGSLGGSEIAPFQAFWVKAEEPGASLTVSPDARTLGGPGFRGKMAGHAAGSGAVDSFDEIVLQLRHHNNDLEAETRLMFSEAGDVSGDRYDAYRLASLSNSYLSVFTIRDDRSQLSINSLPDRVERKMSIPLETYGVIHGMALQGQSELEWNSLHDFPEDISIILVDKRTGDQVDMRRHSSYTFDLASGSSPFFKMAADAGTDSRKSAAKDGPPVVSVNQLGGPMVLHQMAASSDTRFEIRIDRRIPSLDYGQAVPEEVILRSNYPNPFNPSTNIRFSLPEEGRVRLAVYDILGRKVALLADGIYTRGLHEVVWDAGSMSSGTYIYRLEAGGVVRTRKMSLVK
ncbi:T9SS type A sorting domain-containing protein [Balneolales bacterium ANBcel1]|nr:T9SS type A sorting domain-containing protein [Balneolales bacterium ANBcel1]